MYYLFGRVHLIQDLNPRRSGVLILYDDIEKGLSRHFSEYNNPYASGGINDITAIDALLMPGEGLGDLRFLFSTYMSLFSGEFPPTRLGKSASAIRDGRVFCFIDTLQKLSDGYERASVIHVGSGSIQVGDRLHRTVFDARHHQNLHVGAYKMQEETFTRMQGESVYQKILHMLEQDTTSPVLFVKATVEDNIQLSFWYRLSSGRGDILISPGLFVEEFLGLAISRPGAFHYSPSPMGVYDLNVSLIFV